MFKAHICDGFGEDPCGRYTAGEYEIVGGCAKLKTFLCPNDLLTLTMYVRKEKKHWSIFKCDCGHTIYGGDLNV